MKKLARLLVSFFALALLAGCGGSDKGSPADPPPDFRVQGGDGSVILTWTADPELEYWIFFGAGPDITTDNWAVRGGVVIPNAQSPRIITGLANGITYSFTINARKNKGPGGDGAPTQNVVPTLAGENWAPGAPLGTGTLRSIAAGTLLNGFGVVAVGDAGEIYSNIKPGAFAARTNPVAGTHLRAVAYGLAGFMAGGDNGVILQSLDAITWTQKTSGTTERLNAGVSSATAQYVFVGANAEVVTSTDGGGSWTTPELSVNADLFGVTWGAQRFVAVGARGTVLTGQGGTDWTPVADQLTQATLRAAAYGQFLVSGTVTPINVYLVVGDGGVVLRSTDSIEWAVQPSFTTQNLVGVTFGGRFVAVGDDGAIFTSVDGISWQAQNSSTTADLTSVARTLTGYTAVGEAGTNVSTF